MIGKRSAALGLTLALAAGCAPNTGPDEIEPTRPEVTASAAPAPTSSRPAAIEVTDCPNLPGSYYLDLGTFPADKLCATAAGIKGLIDDGEEVTVEEDNMPLPVEPIGSCVLNPLVYVDGGTTYYGFARPSRQSDITGAEVTVVSPSAIIGKPERYEVVLSPSPNDRGYVATLPSGPNPVPVALAGRC